VKLIAYGLEFSDGTVSVYNPYPAMPLPVTLSEGDSYTGFLPKRDVQEEVRSRKAKGVRLTAAYVATADDRKYRQRIWPWSDVLRKQILAGELAPDPKNTDLLDPYEGIRDLLGGGSEN
jgi:hypothetical protein